MKSIITKIKNFDLEAYKIGKENYDNPKKEVEDLAKQRIEKMKLCPSFKPEPIGMFKIKDERIPEADGMYCENCGCSAPYKIRQNLSVCKCWGEN